MNNLTEDEKIIRYETDENDSRIIYCYTNLGKYKLQSSDYAGSFIKVTKCN